MTKKITLNIDYYSDYSCPFCYLASVRLYRVIEKLKPYGQINLNYKSYQLKPNLPKVATQSIYESMMESYGIDLEKARELTFPVIEMALKEGLTFDFDHIQNTNTLLAHRIAKSIQDPKVHALLYGAYFSQNVNLSDELEIKKALIPLGLSEEQFQKHLKNPEALRLVLQDLKEVKEKNISGIPQAYVGQKRLFKGLMEDEELENLLKNQLLEIIQKRNI